ncbi:hypothetical protein [Nocardia sp. NPDC005998]|uniref:hypothetical protein n=1 Tax=Nocardia sp. NPDC005998 TaxID=3156894 RepID=UPI0033B9EC06
MKAAAQMVRRHHFAPDSQPDPAIEYTITDPVHLGRLLAAAESIWLERARAKVRHVSAGDPLAGQNAVIDPALQAVRAYATRMSAQAILRRLRLLPEGSPARALLTDVHRLHTLRGLLPYVADLVRYGYLSADLGRVS